MGTLLFHNCHPNEEATWIGRLAYTWALRIGHAVAQRRLENLRPSPALALLFKLADYLVLENIKRSIGMHRVHYAGTGAAPIAPDLIKWYRALGIDMRELYGQTENCGLATGMPDRIKLGHHALGIREPAEVVPLRLRRGGNRRSTQVSDLPGDDRL